MDSQNTNPEKQIFRNAKIKDPEGRYSTLDALTKAQGRAGTWTITFSPTATISEISGTAAEIVELLKLEIVEDLKSRRRPEKRG